MSGLVRGGPPLKNATDIAVSLLYESPPRQLTRDQVSRAFCQDAAVPVAVLRL